MHTHSGRECHNLCKDDKQCQNRMTHGHHEEINGRVLEDRLGYVWHSILGL